MHGRESSRSLRCAHRLLNGLWRDGLSRRGLRRCHWRRPLLSPQGFHTLLQFLNLLHQKTNGRLITGANCLRRTHPGQQTERNDYLADVGHGRPCLFRSAQRDARNHSLIFGTAAANIGLRKYVAGGDGIFVSTPFGASLGIVLLLHASRRTYSRPAFAIAGWHQPPDLRVRAGADRSGWQIGR